MVIFYSDSDHSNSCYDNNVVAIVIVSLVNYVLHLIFYMDHMIQQNWKYYITRHLVFVLQEMENQWSWVIGNVAMVYGNIVMMSSLLWPL